MTHRHDDECRGDQRPPGWAATAFSVVWVALTWGTDFGAAALVAFKVQTQGLLPLGKGPGAALVCRGLWSLFLWGVHMAFGWF